MNKQELKKTKVQYELMPVYVKAIFPRPEETEEAISQKNLKLGLGEKLGENERKILALIINDKFITIQLMAGKLGISTTAVEKNLNRLKQKGILKRVGSPKGGYWEVINKK